MSQIPNIGGSSHELLNLCCICISSVNAQAGLYDMNLTLLFYLRMRNSTIEKDQWSRYCLWDKNLKYACTRELLRMRKVITSNCPQEAETVNS